MTFPRIRRRRTDETADRLALAFAAFSYALGSAQLIRTGTVNRAMGIPDDDTNHTVQQGIGLRELASGTGLLLARRKAPWMWLRVAGDVMDLAVLGLVWASGFGRRGRLLGAMAFIGLVLAADVRAALRLARAGGR